MELRIAFLEEMMKEQKFARISKFHSWRIESFIKSLPKGVVPIDIKPNNYIFDMSAYDININKVNSNIKSGTNNIETITVYLLNIIFPLESNQLILLALYQHQLLIRTSL